MGKKLGLDCSIQHLTCGLSHGNHRILCTNPVNLGLC